MYMSILQLLTKYTIVGASGFSIAFMKDDILDYFSSVAPLRLVGGSIGSSSGSDGSSGDSSVLNGKMLHNTIKVFSEFTTRHIKNKKMLLFLLGSMGIVAYIDFGDYVYSTRNQLKNGLIGVTDKILVLGGVIETFKGVVYNRFNTIEKKMETNTENIKLVIKQKNDEIKNSIKDVNGVIKDVNCGLKDVRGGLKDVNGGLKDVNGGLKDVRCDLSDVKGNIKGFYNKFDTIQYKQEKSNNLLESFDEKINNVQNKTNFISKGVFMLCNSVLNKKSFENVSEIKDFQQNISNV
jgi:hypothetical protein